MTRPSLSLCLIARDTATSLEECLSSVEKYVDEIVVVDSDSIDATQKVAEAHGAKVFNFTAETHPDCFMIDPDTSKPMLADYGAARNFSFDKSTGDYQLWLDADDILEGADKLPGIIDDMEKHGIQTGFLWYHYGVDQYGNVNCKFLRERILKRGIGAWQDEAHETYGRPLGTVEKTYEGAVVKHHRDLPKYQGNLALRVKNRNYKILKRVYDRGNPSGRTLFYLGNETRFFDPGSAIGYFEQCVRASTWDEERTMARVHLGHLHEYKGDYEIAFRCFASATVDYSDNPEGWFGLARIAYYWKQWGRCCEFTERGFAIKEDKTHTIYNPLDRTFQPHLYYNLALNNVGRTQEALDSCNAGLAIEDNLFLRGNRTIYERYLGKDSTWEMLRQKMSKEVNLEEFKTWNTVRNIPVYNPIQYGFYDHYLADIEALLAPRKDSDLWKKLLKEPKLGHTEASYKEVQRLAFDGTTECTGWTLKSAHHILTFEAITGKKITEYDQIVEFGPGIGETARMILDLGFSGTYYLYDFPEMLRISGFYLQGYPNIKTVSHYSEIPNDKRTLLIGTWSLSEVPYEYRNEIVRHFRGQDFLLVSQNNIFGFDNHPYFVDTFPKESGTRIRTQPIPWLPYGGGNFYAVGLPIEKRSSSSLKIGIWTGPASEPWDASTPYTRGVGGSETACIEMAREFAKLGHQVTVYSDCSKEGMFDSVKYQHYSTLKDGDFDLFVCSRQPWMLTDHDISAAMKVLWVHDTSWGPANDNLNQCLRRFDKILCLSGWHREYFLQTYPCVDPSKVLVTSNGIVPSRFPDPYRVRGNRLIYSSYPSRGLGNLLRVFPRIQKEVPDVELDVFYGFESMRAEARNNLAELAAIDQLEKKVKETPGVVYHGRVDQKTLAEAFMNAKVWAYPTEYWETFCISALEAQASGCVPVTTARAALKETVRSGFTLEPPVDASYNEKFVSTVVQLLQDDELRKFHTVKGIEFASKLSWESLAREWLVLFGRQEILEKAT